MTQKIAVLISGNGSNLQALIDYQRQHPSAYEIALVISNKADAYGLQRAQNADIRTVALDHKQYPSRQEFDHALSLELDRARVDLIVLAGFMRILTPWFTEKYLGKMLNIHPSLLPKYTGLHTHQRALDAGDTEHGLSIHFVTPELDGGPVILQAKVLIEASDDAASLAKKVHTQEHIAYPLVVDWYCKHRIELRDNLAYFDQQLLKTPLLLNAVI
ncbi:MULTISPECIES: phosphoribosylglycinamide formyltransferase [Thiomicrorhabdus]|uniref:Phosphoribosylglycinamide formyltransferase n=1 Tax=Thiomicrorhabdus heinhorstiae TaxID=2748010 RepID=A0ABS0BWR8_9GAMM|nr:MULTISPECIES: phosphoribosylglycinamide formyltransferase [Thiomicrorhabdus]MBF6058257.1 phosphoribosylglycinamide formyltransferase [Thiomicrorhabdus heinhorstiae]